MGWGQAQGPHGTGTTAMVEDAHGALNAVGIGPGVLARRAVEAGGRIARLEEELDDAHRRLFKVALAAAAPDRDHVDRCVDVDLIVGGSDRWRVGTGAAR